jgi:hypothetical protein
LSNRLSLLFALSCLVAVPACSARDRESQLLLDGSQAGYYARLEESGWLRHSRLIVMASVVAAEKLHFDGSSVLVHCSDGWYEYCNPYIAL